MTAALPALGEMTEELLSLLERQQDLMRHRTGQFGALREAILRRKESSVETLLREMTESVQTQSDMDRQLGQCRRALAELLGIDLADLRLPVLAERLGSAQAKRVLAARQAIIASAETLKKAHLAAAMMLSESAKLNRKLLRGLVPRKEQVTTYSSRGNQGRGWTSTSGLIDAEM